MVVYFPQQWCKKYAISVTLSDILTMEKGMWMNDVAVELGMNIIVDNLLCEEIYQGTRAFHGVPDVAGSKGSPS